MLGRAPPKTSASSSLPPPRTLRESWLQSGIFRRQRPWPPFEDLTDPDSIIQLGVAPSRIDLLSSLAAVPDFDPLWDSRVQGRFSDVETQYLSLDDLIVEKEASGRDQDRADVKVLRRAQNPSQ